MREANARRSVPLRIDGRDNRHAGRLRRKERRSRGSAKARRQGPVRLQLVGLHRRDTIAEFEKETGIKVTYDVFDSNEVLETKLLAGNSGYDVVVPTRRLPGAPDRGRRLPEARQVEAAEPREHGPGGDAARADATIPATSMRVNYMWGTTGIGYNVAKVKEALGDATRSTAGR